MSDPPTPKPRRTKAPPKRKRDASVTEESEAEKNTAPQPARRSRTSKASTASTSGAISTARTPRKTTRRPVQSIDSVAEIAEDEEAEPPAKKSRSSSGSGNGEDEEVSVLEKSADISEAERTADEDVPLEDARMPRDREDATQSVVKIEEDVSLLDQIKQSPRPVPSRAPEPEAPKGPRARLVIHKLVLNDFKSYAGRQEIGPFHKVPS